MEKHKKQDEHIFAEKLTKDADIDEDVLLESFRRNETWR